MIISGDGITGSYTVNIKPDFKPLTKLAIEWIQLESGNWVGVDREAAEDVYQADIRIYGTQATIDTFIDEMEANRVHAGTANVIVLSSINSTEHIFGADVDYSGNINCTIVKMDTKTQKTWRGFSLKMRINALSPSFTGSSSLPTLKLLNIGFEGDADYTINKLNSYDGTYTYSDHESDIGQFTGTFLFTDAEMITMRRYIATERNSTIALTAISGVTEPFGSRRAGSYNYNVKIIDWKDMGMFGVSKWYMKITFAEVV